MVHFSTIIPGNHPLYSLRQVVASTLGRVGIAASRLRNRSIHLADHSGPAASLSG